MPKSTIQKIKKLLLPLLALPFIVISFASFISLPSREGGAMLFLIGLGSAAIAIVILLINAFLIYRLRKKSLKD